MFVFQDQDKKENPEIEKFHIFQALDTYKFLNSLQFGKKKGKKPIIGEPAKA